MTCPRLSRRIAAQVLAHAIEDDDRVVGRKAGDGQQRRNHVERQVVAEKSEEREGDQQVVQRRDHGADREAQLKAERDVAENPDHRQDRRPDRLVASARGRRPGRRSRCRAARSCRGCRPAARPRSSRAVVLSEAPASAPTSGTRIIIWCCDGSPDELMTRSWPNVMFERRAHLLIRHRLLEFLDHHGAAGELDALWQSPSSRSPPRRRG